jgi:hypothetical protein
MQHRIQSMPGRTSTPHITSCRHVFQALAPNLEAWRRRMFPDFTDRPISDRNQVAGSLYSPLLSPLCNVERKHGSTHSTVAVDTQPAPPSFAVTCAVVWQRRNGMQRVPKDVMGSPCYPFTFHAMFSPTSCLLSAPKAVYL